MIMPLQKYFQDSQTLSQSNNLLSLHRLAARVRIPKNKSTGPKKIIIKHGKPGKENSILWNNVQNCAQSVSRHKDKHAPGDLSNSS